MNGNGVVRAVSPTQLARYKRAAGLALSPEELEAVRAADRRYAKCKLSLYVPEKLRQDWEAQAGSKGMSFSEWARDRIAECVAQQSELARLLGLLRESNLAAEDARRDALREAKRAEDLKAKLDEMEREYAFLLRRSEVKRP